MSGVINIALSLLFSVTAASQATESPKYWDKSNWESLEKGMAERQVAELLGDPIDKRTSPIAMIWYYRQMSTDQDKRTSDGFVRFKKVQSGRRSKYEVFDWSEPDWQWVQSQIEAVVALEQARIAQAQAQARQQAELERQRALEEQRQAELLAERRRQQQAEAARRAAQRKTKPKSFFSKDHLLNMARRHGLAAGGILLALLIIRTLFFKKIGDAGG